MFVQVNRHNYTQLPLPTRMYLLRPQSLALISFPSRSTSFSSTRSAPANAIPILVAAIIVIPGTFGLKSPCCSSLIVLKYLRVPCATHILPLATRMPAASLVRLFSRWRRVGEMAANASTFSRATPRAIKPNPVRAQERNVRSDASRSRATEPVFFNGSAWKGERIRRNIVRRLRGFANVLDYHDVDEAIPSHFAM